MFKEINHGKTHFFGDGCKDEHGKITPQQKENCSCGEPHISDRIIHRYDGKPCYVIDGTKEPQQGWEKELMDLCFELRDRTYGSHYRILVKFFRQLLQKEREEILRSEKERQYDLMMKCLPKEKGKEAEEKGDMWIEEIKGFNSCRSEIIKTAQNLWGIKL